MIVGGVPLWIRRWFGAVWTDRQRRFRVAGEYRALATSQFLLADLCARNFVFAPIAADNLFDAGVAEGRRRAVLEVLQLARIEPGMIAEIEVQPKRGESNAD